MHPERATTTPRRRLGARRWAAIGSVAMLAILVGGTLAAVAALRDDVEFGFEPTPSPTVEQPHGSATPTPSAAPQPTATPTPEPTSAQTQTPVPTPEPPLAEAVLEPIGFALNTVDRLSLRAEPGLDAERSGSLSADSVSVVLDGPVSADGYTWYQLSGLGMPFASGCAGPLESDPWEQAPLNAPTIGCPAWLGWVAAASLDGESWLVPVSRTAVGCPSSPLAVDEFWRLGSGQPLGCFAGQQITVRGWYAELPPDFASGIVCDPSRPDEVTWLMCPSFDALSSDDTYWEGPLPLKIDPASGVSMPERGQWLEVTGFYDHPLARRCSDNVADPAHAAATTLECRRQFVVSDVRVVSGP